MYKIIASELVHNGPARCLYFSAGEIYSGGQDSCLKRSMLLSETESDGSESISLASMNSFQHDHWVTATHVIATGLLPSHPHGLIITGCMDHLIRCYDSLSGELVSLLQGHTKGVISFSFSSESSLLYSGSWDGTAKAWNLETMSLHQTYGPHENGVHVLALPENTLATVSTGESVNMKPANFKLRLWDLSSGLEKGRPIEDHSGPIRSIFAVEPLGFATTSNDGGVYLRAANGSLLGMMFHEAKDNDGYPPFILDGTALYGNISGESLVVSAGEDGSLMVWSGTELLQSMKHPNCVWAVAALPGGEFVTAGNDGVLRVFSTDPAKTESPRARELQQQFESQVTDAMMSSKQGPSQDEIDKLPKWESRDSKPGKSEGMVAVFNRDGKAIAAQWSGDRRVWDEIGEVMGSRDGGEVNGVTYDHILPVEIETTRGVMTLQLGYNDGENSTDVAQRFVDENQLQRSHVQQISDFIMQRTGSTGTTLGTAPPNKSKAATESAPKQRKSAYFPLQTFVSFPDVVSDVKNKVVAKISQLNADGSARPAMSDEDLETVKSLLETLSQTSRYHASSISGSQLAGVMHMAVRWDSHDVLFPSFDVLRMTAGHPEGGAAVVNHRSFAPLMNRVVSLLQLDPRQSSKQCNNVGAETESADAVHNYLLALGSVVDRINSELKENVKQLLTVPLSRKFSEHLILEIQDSLV